MCTIIVMTQVIGLCVQRVLEDRVPKLLEKFLIKPSLLNPPPMEEGGLIQVSFFKGPYLQINGLSC